MPVSRVQRWMRGQWPVVLRRAQDYARQIPPDGVRRGRFVADVLTDVDPRECDQVVELLGRRGAVWLSRYRGEVTVYGCRPEARVEKDLVGGKPIDAFVADLAPLVLDAARKVEAGWSRGSPPEAQEAARVAVGRIIALCERKTTSGLPLADMRDAMWSIFADGLMKAVARYEPRLQRQSEAEAFEAVTPRPKRLPRGLTPKQKAFALIERAGPQGVTKSDVQKSIQPRISANDLAEIIGELETQGRIVWGEMRLRLDHRPGVRLFTAEVGLPKLHNDGTMFHREPEPA